MKIIIIQRIGLPFITINLKFFVATSLQILKETNELPAFSKQLICLLGASHTLVPVLASKTRDYINTHGLQPGALGAEWPGN
jgi:hypothetical protein